MKRYKIFLKILAGVLLMVFPGCTDDIFEQYGNGDSEGESLLSLSANFSPFAGNVLSRSSNVAPARGFNDISDMAILVFSVNDGMLKSCFEPIGYNVADCDREDANASNSVTAEADTKRVTDISFKLPYGRYYIVAVANYGSYELEGGSVKVIKSSLEKLRENLDFENGFSMDDLFRLRVKWDKDYVNNRAMLGYFTQTDQIPHSESSYQPVTVNQPVMNLQGWIRRCASKITVDFDGSALRDNVSIYIKDVRICDLASSCSLGFGYPESTEENVTDFNNRVTSNISPFDYQNSEYPEDYPLIKNDGSYIDFSNGKVAELWPCITNHTPYITDSEGNKKDLHTQDSECLYFYENMQGTREGYNRTPVPDLATGGVAEGYNWKDGMPFGTYVEVTALHRSEVNGEKDDKLTKYRFMLGKNVIDNFDAERNYHYKLTLSFLGNANEYHWHIDYNYDFEEGFKVPNPWYVSYVYNHDAYLPFEFNLSEDWEIESMTARIIDNPWYPTTSSSYEGAEEDLADPDYEITPSTPSGDDSYPYENGDNKYTGNGFLSLRQPLDKSELTDTETGQTWPGYGASGANKVNQNYFDGEAAGAGVESKNHGKREIIKNAQVVDEGTEREKISVKRKKDVYSINIPLFTREKNLITQTGYTGNNPFVGYQRVAKVLLTAKIRKKDDHSVTDEKTAKVNVVQVRRVVNPKGVYRRAGNSEDFRVVLKFLTSERADGEFQSIISRGPWMAEVLGDANFITLDGRQHVTGTAGTNIDFKIKFNRMNTGGNKNAIVRIKYHNYTCTHLIFVRQGYEAQNICGGGPVYGKSNASATLWETFNLVTGNQMADDPRDEGSMFKYGNYNQAISSVNNIYKDENDNFIFYEQSKNGFTAPGDLEVLDIDGTKDSKTWDELGSNVKGFVDLKDNNGVALKISVASRMADFEQLYLTKNIEFGYGVLYADGARETQSSLEMVNGWYRDDKSPDKNKKGMRGVFAYYWNPVDPADSYNGKNIFFPIGRSGYGHRKNSNEDKNPLGNMNGKGILRYSSSRSAPAMEYTGQAAQYFQNVAPLFEFLYRRMGAIYYTREMTPANQYLLSNGKTEQRGASACGLDMNYFTFDVNAITNVDLDYGNDACFVRPVKASAW